MTCREFKKAWNERIDAEANGTVARRSLGAGEETSNASHGELALAERERALLDHAAQCAACRQVGAGYQALRQALRVWGPPPAPPAGLAGRILAEVQARAPSAWAVDGGVRRKPVWPMAAALAAMAATAAVIAIALPMLNRSMDRRRPDGASAVLHNTPFDPGHDHGRDSETGSIDTRSLNLAVADATAATWDLARSASEPATRISREVLAAATTSENKQAPRSAGTGAEPLAPSVAVPSLDGIAPDTAAAGAMLQQVGDHLVTRVRPLSESARQAFGFLLGPPIARPEVSANPRAQKGA
jgi:hypothetical protein